MTTRCSTEHDSREVVQLAAAAPDANHKAQQRAVVAVQEGNKRHLRVEWMYTVDDDDDDAGDYVQDRTPEQRQRHKQRISMSEKRHFLRLAALAVMTKSQLILVDHDGNTTVVGGADRDSSSSSSNSSSNTRST